MWYGPSTEKCCFFFNELSYFIFTAQGMAICSWLCTVFWICTSQNVEDILHFPKPNCKENCELTNSNGCTLDDFTIG